MSLAQVKANEARRRLQLLGTTVEDTRGVLLGVRVRQVGIPVAILRQWHGCYLRGGLDAMVLTEWPELPESTWALIERRYAALGALAEAETVTVEDLRTLAERAGWTMRQARRWLRRYRLGGMVGLAPDRRRVPPSVRPDLGALAEAQRDELFRRSASVLSHDPILVQSTTWRIGWQKTTVLVRTLQRTVTPHLVLVIDEATDNVLAFRSTQDCPCSADVLFALYDALVFSRQDRWCLHPPARLRVQQPLPPEMIRAAKTWGTEVEEVTHHEFAFVQH